jgi:hypothetical protein
MQGAIYELGEIIGEFEIIEHGKPVVSSLCISSAVIGLGKWS